jgi:serine/threonine-protein kinase
VIGRSINNYQIRAQIGQGGMGTVYVAEHPFIRRKAAIKILRRAYLADEGMVSLFMNEARAANAIRHPNIVDIMDVGRLEDGQPYLMMEFLDGETLADRLGRVHRLPGPDALDFVQQAAEALAVAHDRGIVHRDLKPENLLLVPDLGASSGERVKVLDFGIAKLRGQARDDSSSGLIILGSPLYMAPEQATPDEEIDHRADIYSLGGLLYHALCGVPPFVSDAVGGLLAMHMLDAPTAPRAIDPDIPAHVEEVILRALAKRPQDRFASMRALAAALRAGPPRRRSESRALARDHGRDDTHRLPAPPRRRGRARLVLALAVVGLLAGSLNQEWLTTSLRARSSALLDRLARATLRPRSTTAAAPAESAPAGPVIVPMPAEEPEEVPAPRRSVRPASRAAVGGFGRDVLDRDDLWGRRH